MTTTSAYVKEQNTKANATIASRSVILFDTHDLLYICDSSLLFVPTNKEERVREEKRQCVLFSFRHIALHSHDLHGDIFFFFLLLFFNIMVDDYKQPDEKSILGSPPSYTSSVIQMPPPPYMPRQSSYPHQPLLATHYGETFLDPVLHPQSNDDDDYDTRSTRGGVNASRYLQSWKAVLREGRWTLLGCCSCLALIFIIIVTVIVLRPGYHKIHH